MSDESEGPRGPADEPVGTPAEEAVKLLGALAGWVRDHGTDLGTDLGAGVAGMAGHAAAAAARDVDEHLATGAAECSYCPICRTVHVVRQASPEVRAHLASATASLMQAAAGMLATAQPRAERDGPVERIDLDDDGAWPEDPDAPEAGSPEPEETP